MCVLQDVSLLKENALGCVSNLRKDFSLSGLVVMYVGNFEPYQGIGLLLKSFARVLREVQGVDLVLIGGESSDLEKYRNQVGCLGMREKVHFLGHQPVEHLADYLAQADILVSPRLKGNNTPMKIYSYLHSAKPIVATNLPTHTQVLNERVAVLGAPTPEDFSKGLLDLIQNESLRLELGKAGKKLVEENYSEEKFREKLMKFYDELEKELCEK
ncbi:MAG: glycosyltransferase family 4 protein [Chlamydiae bacterium]|nr:glycosyltransferase family 4 protein [Chlamydiota bacterium]MBI3266857.1 glycosyltransferase family 4 protein [Chlamydiota bacterium]